MLASRNSARDVDHAAGGPIAVAAWSDARASRRDLRLRYATVEMLIPLIGARLHGWLDDLVVLVYLAGAFALGLGGASAGEFASAA